MSNRTSLSLPHKPNLSLDISRANVLQFITAHALAAPSRSFQSSPHRTRSYYVAGVCIVMNVADKRQRFFTCHRFSKPLLFKVIYLSLLWFCGMLKRRNPHVTVVTCSDNVVSLALHKKFTRASGATGAWLPSRAVVRGGGGGDGGGGSGVTADSSRTGLHRGRRRLPHTRCQRRVGAAPQDLRVGHADVPASERAQGHPQARRCSSTTTTQPS